MRSLDDFMPLAIILLGMIFAFTARLNTPGAFYRTVIVSIVVFLLCVFIVDNYTKMTDAMVYQMSAVATIIVAMVVNRFG